MRDNNELRFCLRSIEKHFKSDYDITIVGRKVPDWLTGVKHVSHAKGLKSALVAAANEYPDGFFWMYDDCCLLRDMTADEMMVTPCCKGWQTAKTSWAKNLTKIKTRLDSEGMKAWDYSRPHGPYWYDKSMVDESFTDWKGMAGKFPFETWILSKRDWPRRHGAVKQYYGTFKGAPAEGKWWFLNYNDKGNTHDLREFLNSTFPPSLSYENNSNANPEMKIPNHLLKGYGEQADRLFEAWVDMGKPHLNTVCEVGIGPVSLIGQFSEECSKIVMIDANYSMVEKAIRDYPSAEVHHNAIWDKEELLTLKDAFDSSFIADLGWVCAATPASKVRKGSSRVVGLPFPVFDDGEIDLLNIDCEGCEHMVLEQLVSRPKIIQVEIHPDNTKKNYIEDLLFDMGYTLFRPVPTHTFIYKLKIMKPIYIDCSCPSFGLGNKITQICSGYAVGKMLNRPVFLYWEQGNSCRADFLDMFKAIDSIPIVESIPDGADRFEGWVFRADKAHHFTKYLGSKHCSQAFLETV